MIVVLFYQKFDTGVEAKHCVMPEKKGKKNKN